MVDGKACAINCCKCSCCCALFLPWFALVLLTMMAHSAQPSFCTVEGKQAAADARPDVYSKDGTIDWSTVSTGWNTACGDPPGTFAEMAEMYAAETGGRALLEGAAAIAAFEKNPWSGGNFKVLKMRDVGQVGDFPFGSRAQTVRSFGRLFQVNLFWMPTATSETAGWLNLEYEVCAYFEAADGVYDMRLYMTTESALGSAGPFVQQFHKEEDDLFQYDVISDRYNDDDTGLGKARFSSEATPGCAIWSEAEGATPMVALIVVLSLLLLGYICLLIFLWRRAKSLEA